MLRRSRRRRRSARARGRSTAGSSRGRRQYVAEATQALEEQLTHRLIESFDAFVDDVSNWYIRRSRRRFWDGDEAALRVLWHALVQGLRGIAPGDAVPRRAPLAEPRRRTPARTRPRASSSPAGRKPVSRMPPCSPRSRRCGPSSSSATERATPRRVKLRQPLRSLVRRGRRPRDRPRRGDRGGAARRSRVAFEPLAGAGSAPSRT